MEAAFLMKARRLKLEELYAAHAGDARRLAYMLVGDPNQAEDITQEAFIRVMGHFGNLRQEDSFKTYLMRTVVNLSKNHFRRRSLEQLHVRSAGPPGHVRLPERNDDLLEALGKLPERQRAALVLRFCEDLSEQQTADILHTSTKAVRSLVGRGLAALRTQEEALR